MLNENRRSDEVSVLFIETIKYLKTLQFLYKELTNTF